MKRYNKIEQDIVFYGIEYEMFKDKQARLEQEKAKQK